MKNKEKGENVLLIMVNAGGGLAEKQSRDEEGRRRHRERAVFVPFRSSLENRGNSNESWRVTRLPMQQTNGF